MNSPTFRRQSVGRVGAKDPDEDFLPSRIEGIALVFLSHAAKIRATALELLEGVRKVSHWLTMRKFFVSNIPVDNIGLIYPGSSF